MKFPARINELHRLGRLDKFGKIRSDVVRPAFGRFNISDLAVFHINERIAPDKSAGRPQLAIILEQNQIAPLSVISQKIGDPGRAGFEPDDLLGKF